VSAGNWQELAAAFLALMLISATLAALAVTLGA
jgi:hypothetical protein